MMIIVSKLYDGRVFLGIALTSIGTTLIQIWVLHRC